MNVKRLASLIFQVVSSGILYYIVYKLCETIVAVHNYYIFGEMIYLTKVPDIHLRDLIFTLSIFRIIYLFIQVLIFLACFFSIVNFIKRKFSAKKKSQMKITSTDEMSFFFNKSNVYFNKIKQQKRYTVSCTDELPSEKMKYLSKRKLST